LGKHSGGIPGSVVRSLEEIAGRALADNHLLEMCEVSNAEVVLYSFPKDFPAWVRREKAFDKRNVYFLKDVIVSPDSGMVWTPDGYIFQESVGSLQRILGWGGVLHEPLLPTSTNCIEECLIPCPDTGYFHWLLEIMPNVLDALDVAPDARILVSHKRSRYATDGLRILLGEKAIEERCLVQTSSQVCSRLIMPTCEPYSGFILPRNVEILRNALQPSEKDLGLKDGRKFYVSRRNSPKRAVENEQELETSLEKDGFEVICLEKMDLKVQIETLSQALVVVGMHGAGLANMIWARKPCHIIEIFPVGCYNDCFARLALTCGYEYSMVRCRENQTGTNGLIPIHEVLCLANPAHKEMQ